MIKYVGPPMNNRATVSFWMYPTYVRDENGVLPDGTFKVFLNMYNHIEITVVFNVNTITLTGMTGSFDLSSFFHRWIYVKVGNSHDHSINGAYPFDLYN